MFAILHAFMLWHENRKNGRVRLACDNLAVVNAMANHSISGPAIHRLQTILLIASLFDIEIMVFWIPSKENIVADAASQFNFKKLADLGFQDQLHTLCHPPSSSAMSNLLQKLNFSYIKPSPQQLGELMSQSNNHTKPTGDIIATCPTPLLPRPSPTGLPKSWRKLNQPRRRLIATPFSRSTFRATTPYTHSTTWESTSSSKAANQFSAKANDEGACHSQPTSCTRSSRDSASTSSMTSTSKQRSVWRLPDSYDLVNLRGKPGTPHLGSHM